MVTLPAYKLDALLKQTKLGPTMRQACRYVLCEGMRAREAAQRLGVTDKAVYKARARVLNLYKAIFLIPADWHTLTVTVPPDVAHVIAEAETQAWQAHGLGPPP